jgi:hypothetical protein
MRVRKKEKQLLQLCRKKKEKEELDSAFKMLLYMHALTMKHCIVP